MPWSVSRFSVAPSAETVARSVTVITALAPVIGYAPGAALAKEALASEGRVADLVESRGLLEAAELEKLLTPSRLTGVRWARGFWGTGLLWLNPGERG